MPRQAILFLCRRNTWTLLLALSIFSTGRAHSPYNKDYHVDIQQVDARYGLESIMIRSIYQDKKGFIWITTPGGLARFNGHEFAYFKDPKIIGAIDYGIEILGEIEGKLIVAENRSVVHNPKQKIKKYFIPYLLDPVTGKILPFSASSGKHAPFKGRIHFMTSHKETLYVGSSEGQIYAYSKGKWSLFYSGPSKAPIRQLLMDSPGNPFWVLAGDTLSYITSEGKRLDHQYLDLNTSFWGLRLDANGKVWIYTIQPGEKTAVYYKVPGKPLQSKHPVIGDLSRFGYINIDRMGRIWLWGKNTFHIFDQAGQKLVEIPAQTSMMNIPLIFFDADNRAWISQRQEFNIVRVSKKRFKQILDEPSVSARQMVEVRPGVVWAATYEGLFEYSTDDPTSTRIIPVPTPLMFGLCKAGPYIWIGTHGEQLVRLDSRNKKYEKWPIAAPPEANTGIIHLLNPFVDKKGNVWVGSSRGTFLVDTLRRQVYRDARFNKDGLEQCEVNFQWENDEGIWTATNKGLYLLDMAQGVKNYFSELAPYSISYIHEKPKGIFWMATREYGLIRWERNTRLITHFGIPEGIVKPNLHAILEDKKGRFWMPSDRGLIYFDPVTHFVQIFFESDGLTHDEFNRRSYLKLLDGSFIFGGIAGLNHFHPRDFDELDRPPSALRITDYDVWDPDQRKFISQTGQLV